MTAAPPVDPRGAQVFAGRYELLEPLGRGGMGEVWTGRDTALGGRKVAVKVLHAARLASLAGTGDPEELRRRFLREARATARIDHPGLVTVYDAGAEGETLFLVMQLVEGCDLADHLAEHDGGPYPWAWAVAVLAQLSTALAAVHALGIVHRDIKPANIMVRPDGRLTVLDLGIAAVRGDAEDTRLTRTGTLLGTPLYMAPEQALGGSPVGPAADLYALGVLGHELLTGEVPFTAPDPAGLLYRKLHEPPARVDAVRGDVPAPLGELIGRLLATEPDRRPAGAQELYAALAPLLPRAEAGAPARPMDPTRPFTHPMAPWPPPSPAAAAAPRSGAGDVAAMVEEIKRLLTAGRTGEAAALLHRALPLAAERYGETSTVHRTLRKQYAATLLDGGDYARALPEIRWLLAVFGPERGPYDPLIAQLRADEQLCLQALGPG